MSGAKIAQGLKSLSNLLNINIPPSDLAIHRMPLHLLSFLRPAILFIC